MRKRSPPMVLESISIVGPMHGLGVPDGHCKTISLVDAWPMAAIVGPVGNEGEFPLRSNCHSP